MSTLKLKQNKQTLFSAPSPKRNIHIPPTPNAAPPIPKPYRIENVAQQQQVPLLARQPDIYFGGLAPRFEIIYWRHFPLWPQRRNALDHESLLRAPQTGQNHRRALAWELSSSKLCLVSSPFQALRRVAWWNPAATPSSRRDENRSREHYCFSRLLFFIVGGGSASAGCLVLKTQYNYYQLSFVCLCFLWLCWFEWFLWLFDCDWFLWFL